jgi:hypothetical protein
MKHSLARTPTPTALLARLIDSPALAETVRALPPPAFAALIRQVGLEDGGELVALATTEQLVTAFDEDLFENPRPGEREVFDPARFVTWLEILLEAGDAAAAARVAELSEDFVTQALHSLVVVLDEEALRNRMEEQDDDAVLADKALDAALSEELDGYLMLSRTHDGWDAVLALILALDRDHRALLVRVLDRCAAMSSDLVEDLDALTTVLSEGESLREDVEAEREERRSRAGFVEPRAAKSFLTLAARGASTDTERDPVTRAYFRELDRSAPRPSAPPAETAQLMGWLGAMAEDGGRASAGSSEPRALQAASPPMIDAMRELRELAPKVFAERMDELAYLANVLVAGATLGDRRFRPSEAAEAALATVALGAELAARELASPAKARRPTEHDVVDVLQRQPADVLFRVASAALAKRPGAAPFLRDRSEVVGALAELTPPAVKKARRAR